MALEGQFYPVFRVVDIEKHQYLLVHRHTNLKDQDVINVCCMHKKNVDKAKLVKNFRKHTNLQCSLLERTFHPSSSPKSKSQQAHREVLSGKTREKKCFFLGFFLNLLPTDK